MKKVELPVKIYIIDAYDNLDINKIKQNISIQNPSLSIVYTENLQTYDSDIIIVNPKIMLIDNWIINLHKCANSYCNIGTVSPLMYFDLFSNKDNIEKEILELLKIDNILLQCTSDLTPDVDYNVFDCVYIKKEVLKETNLPVIDKTSSEKLIEWFFKVSQFGWKHRICDYSIVIEGELLFDDIKLYNNRLNEYCKKCINIVYDKLCFAKKLHFNNGKKNIMHYLLADFQEGAADNVGGTQFHVKDLVSYQKDKFNVWVLARDGEHMRLTQYVDDNSIQFKFWVGAKSPNVIFYDKKHEELYSYLLKAIHIDLIHIHHTMHLPLNLYYIGKQLEIPIILTLHDYYYNCPVLKMINTKGDLCDNLSCNNDCNDCLFEYKNITNSNGYLEKWYHEHGKAMGMCNRIVSPSVEAQQVMKKRYPVIKEKGIVIEHGINVQCLCNNSHSHENVSKKNLRVAFIGGIGELKGAKVIYDMIVNDKSNSFEWFIMGGIGTEDLFHLQQHNLTKTGWYQKNDIFDLLKDNAIDIVCILSIVAETFCYTLSESLAVGIPVIATDVGALGRRVRESECGWVVPRDASAEDVLRILLDIKNNPNQLFEKINNISNIKIKNIDEMGNEYDELYNNVFLDGKVSEIVNLKYLFDNINNNAVVCNSVVQNTELEIDEKIRLQILEEELSNIKKSLLVKIALYLRTIKIPGKQKIKDLIYKIGRLFIKSN